MAKLVTPNLASLANQTSAVAAINSNFDAVDVAMENTLSRDGTAPNAMEADFDMNTNRILNLPEPLADTEPLRLIDAQPFVDAAEAAQAAAELALDQFTDIYLGQKGSDPALDNDNTALQIGALYYNTTSDAMRVYTATGWRDVVTAANLTDVVDDTSPQLGGNLDLNGHNITGTGNISITGTGTFTGIVDASDVTVDDEVYGAGWNGSVEVPTKNALYDKIENLGTGTVTTGTTKQIAYYPSNGTSVDGTGQIFVDNTLRHLIVGGDTIPSGMTAASFTAFGVRALAAAGATIGIDETAFGADSLMSDTSGTENTAVGDSALRNLTTGTNNSALGSSAGASTNGDFNTYIGVSSAETSTTGDNNVAIGVSALNAIASDFNVGVGVQALIAATAGNNTGVGGQCLYYVTTGTGNTAIGRLAGQAGSTPVSTGSNNTFLGYITGSTANVSNSTAIGHGAQVSASNQVVIGNGSVTSVTINGSIQSPTFVTPALGTPASGALTNCTGLPVSTGISGLGSNVATFLATPSSANLLAAVTDETGTGALVFGTAPTFTTSITAPLVIGGSGTTGTQLTLKTTTGTGTTDALAIVGGTNGGTTFGTFTAVKLDVPQTTQSTTTSTGAITTAGGLGVAKAIRAGEGIYSGTTFGLSTVGGNGFFTSGGYIIFQNGGGGNSFLMGGSNNGDPTNYYDNDTHRFRSAASVAYGEFSSTGINSVGNFSVDGTQVLTNRITGWGAPTGTATRTTFATSTVTTAQLAERVKALIDDLTTHGVIGA